MVRWYDNPGAFRAKYRGLVHYLEQPASVGLVIFAALMPLMTMVIVALFFWLGL